MMTLGLAWSRKAVLCGGLVTLVPVATGGRDLPWQHSSLPRVQTLLVAVMVCTGWQWSLWRSAHIGVPAEVFKHAAA